MRLISASVAAACGVVLLVGSVNAATTSITVVVQDAEGRPVPDAVVYLETDAPAQATGAPTVVIDQRDKRFVPKVSVIQTGTEVTFPNSDAVSHHVYSFADSNSFELPLYKGETQPAITFANPGLVTLGCNIHDSMLGYILIVETPYFAVADATGKATVSAPDVLFSPERIHVWSPRLGKGGIATIAKTAEVSGPGKPNTLIVTIDDKFPDESTTTGGSLSWDDY